MPKVDSQPRPSPDRCSLLAVTSEAPWPLDTGGHLRTYHLLRTLTTAFDVRLVAPASGRDDEGCRALARAGLHPRLVPVSARTAVTETVKVGLAAVRREPYVMFSRHRYRAVARALRDEIKVRRPDVLYLDHLDSLVYAGGLDRIPLIIDMHNVYSRLVSRAAVEAGGAVRRRYLEGEAALIARMEQRAVALADTILAVSADDASYFTGIGAKRVVVVPNGVDCDAYERLPAGARTGPPTILYVGSLTWPPNVSAARFLAAEVLPLVRRRLPDARVVIVGKDPDPDLMALARATDGVDIAGHVPDVAAYFRSAHVLAVPLESGGGTRLKILEAFGAGLPVISTPVGCEGIAANDGEHLVIADRRDFAAGIIDLLLDPVGARNRAQRAKRLARQRYDWPVVGALACAAVAEASRTAAAAPHRLAIQPTVRIR
ncbi:MAG: glycosyltransferase family 4 protein [Acidobacteriota bacterium]